MLAWLGLSLWLWTRSRCLGGARGWVWAAAAYGLACASKPTAWFLAPFYLLLLAGVAAGQHFISVTLGSQVVALGLLVDRQPPTSTVTGPTIVAAPTFTVTLRGGDDLSGVGEYLVQYRIGASGVWTDWLTRPAGWDYASGGPASLTFTFGPTQPAALQPGQTVHFRTRAVDRADNREAEHPAADLAVTYGAQERRIYLPLVLRQ